MRCSPEGFVVIAFGLFLLVFLAPFLFNNLFCYARLQLLGFKIPAGFQFFYATRFGRDASNTLIGAAQLVHSHRRYPVAELVDLSKDFPGDSLLFHIVFFICVTIVVFAFTFFGLQEISAISFKYLRKSLLFDNGALNLVLGSHRMQVILLIGHLYQPLAHFTLRPVCYTFGALFRMAIRCFGVKVRYVLTYTF